MRYRLLLATLAFLLPNALHADETDPTWVPPALAPIIARLHPQHGKIVIGKELAIFNLTQDFSYLTPDETELLMRATGFSAKANNLGAIIPSTVPIGSPASWVALVTYQQDGHVREDSAQELNASALMRRLQEENNARNDTLKAHGYRFLGVDIVGWSEEPRYDNTTHTLTWGLEFVHYSNGRHEIDYYIRILTRHGTIAITIPCRLEQLPMIESGIKKIANFTEFNASNRYADFNPGTDKAAGYNMADMILGNTNAAEGVRARDSLGGKEYWIIAIALAIAMLLYMRCGRRSALGAKNNLHTLSNKR